MTPLDDAHRAMAASRDDAAARLQFYQQLADTELFVLLESEATQDSISPELFEVEDGRFVLAFDSEERLAAFSGRVAPYAAMSGRVLARMLEGQGIGLGLNLEVAPSSFLIPSTAVDWLNRTLAQAPDRIEARITGFHAPSGLADAMIAALEAKLINAGGLAQAAFLAGASYEDGGRGLLLGFVGVAETAQDSLAKAAGEALTFAGIETGALDVGFFAPDDPATAHLAAAGRRLNLPLPAPREAPARPAPGSDPDKPPILR